MDSMRWRHLAPPALAVAAFVAATASTPGAVGAADPPWSPAVCVHRDAVVDGPSATVLGRVAGRIAGRTAAAGAAWFRLDPILDGGGTLVGRRLTSGDAASGTRRRLDLPPESFASGPFGDVVLVGGDDGRRSTLRLVDPVAGCAIEAGESADVVRSGLVTPAGDGLVEHRVDRRTREDLGVWRRSFEAAPASRLLPPLPADAAYGPTFATELAWGTDGRLAAVSCGQSRCRARIVDPADGVTATVPDVGTLVGLSGGTLVMQRPCAGLPCPIEAISLETGHRRVLAADAGLAVLGGDRRQLLVWESADAAGTHLHRTDLVTGRTVELAMLPAGYLPQTSAARSRSALATPKGWILVVPNGRVPLDVGRGRGHLIDPLDGSAATLGEMVP